MNELAKRSLVQAQNAVKQGTISMKRTAIVYSPRYLAHKTGPSDPESPKRLRAIMKGIEQESLLKKANFSLIEPRSASTRELQLAHNPEYINLVKRISESGGGFLGDYTVASRESFEVARLAAGGAIKAVDKVMSGEFRNAFVLARPPGHHAGHGYALGFCIFNNVALSAAYLLQNHGLDRVLILDIDAHHGNGTQEIFYDTDEVLYISLHEDPTEFPETGFTDETGREDGEGYTVNIPLPFGSGDPVYWKAVKTIAAPIARQYKPQFMLVSAGFDGYYRDTAAELSLSAYIYPVVFQAALDIANKSCEDRIAAILEGGYRLWFLRKIVPAAIAKIAGINMRIRDARPFLNLDAEREAEKTLERVKRVQSEFWEL